MAFILVTCSLVLGIVLSIFLLYIRWRKIDMPGPKGLQIIGKALQLDRNRTYIQLHEWSKQYGSIFKLQLFSEEVVVCNDYESIMMTKSDDFAGRPKSWRYTYATPGGDNGIAFQDFNKSSRLLRKLATQGLRPYTAHDQNTDDIATKPINECLEEFLSHDGKPFNPNLHVDHCVVKFILNLILGGHVKITANDFTAVERMVRRMEHMAQGSGEELEIFPWLRLFGVKSYRDLMELNKIGNDVIDSWITRCRNERKEGPETSNEESEQSLAILDLLLSAYDDGIIDIENIKSTLFETVIAGTVTIKAHIESLILLMLNYPEVQERVIKEIRHSVPGDKHPSFADREKLPYTEATVLEAVRFMTISPLGVPHKTVSDTTLGPYKIPKDTQIWTNIWSLHHDPRYFPDPYTFNPDRFLNNEGKTFNIADIKSTGFLKVHDFSWPQREGAVLQLFLPFGVGKRKCLGEKIGIARVFLFFSSMMQKMRLLPADECDIPSCDLKTFTPAISYQPPNFFVKVEPFGKN